MKQKSPIWARSRKTVLVASVLFAASGALSAIQSAYGSQQPTPLRGDTSQMEYPFFVKSSTRVSDAGSDLLTIGLQNRNETARAVTLSEEDVWTAGQRLQLGRTKDVRSPEAELNRAVDLASRYGQIGRRLTYVDRFGTEYTDSEGEQLSYQLAIWDLLTRSDGAHARGLSKYAKRAEYLVEVAYQYPLLAPLEPPGLFKLSLTQTPYLNGERLKVELSGDGAAGNGQLVELRSGEGGGSILAVAATKNGVGVFDVPFDHTIGEGSMRATWRTTIPAGSILVSSEGASLVLIETLSLISESNSITHAVPANPADRVWRVAQRSAPVFLTGLVAFLVSVTLVIGVPTLTSVFQ